MMITGRSGAIRLSSACKPCPVIPAIRRSEISTSGASRSTIARASWPEFALSGWYPAWRRISDSALTMSWSSSTTRTVACPLCAPLLPGAGFIFDYLAGRNGDRDHEPRSRWPRAERYLATVLAYDRLADCQTHAGSLARLLGGEKWGEDAILVLGSDAPASIFERKHHARALSVVLGVRGYSQRSATALHR